jgi:hypothetical protein
MPIVCISLVKIQAMKKTDRVMTVESGQHRAYRTYKTEGISPAITTPTGGGLIPKIIEMKEDPKIVSYSRDKKGKIENYHTKEVANTIHCSTGTRGNTAQYVLEPKPIVEMNKYPSNHACGKVYNVGGGISYCDEQPRRDRLYRRAVRGGEQRKGA